MGVAVNATAFEIVDSVLYSWFGFKDPGHVVAIEKISPNDKWIGISTSDFADFRRQTNSFQQLAAFAFGRFNLASRSAQPQRVVGLKVTANFLSTLGANPVLGSDFTAEQEQPGMGRVALVSYGFWQRRFGGSPDLIGKSITFNGQPFTVIGILPASFRIGGVPDVLVPVPIENTGSEEDGDVIAIRADVTLLHRRCVTDL